MKKLNIISLVLHSLVARIASLTAKEKAQMYSKHISFRIPKGSLKIESRRELTSSWFAEYRLRPRGELLNSNGNNRYDPYFSIATVMNDGVYYTRIEDTWRKLDEEDYLYKNLEIGLEFGTQNLITAATSTGNYSVLLIANQDMMVRTLDLRYFKDDGALKIVTEVDLSYGEDEGDFAIRSIWMVPYSTQAIASPNRYEIFKFDFLSGEKEIFENKLGPIKHIVGPVMTDFPEREPYNPSTDRTSVPQHIRNSEENPFFIATGSQSPMNFVGDWTTLEPIRFFSFEKYSSKMTIDDPIDFKVQSIAFIGHKPNSHIYATTLYNAKFLFLYNAMFQKVDMAVVCSICDEVESITWINGTSLVYLQRNKSIGILYYIDDFKQIEITSGVNEMKKQYSVSVEMEMGGEDEDEFWEGFSKLDRLWLSLENVQGKLSLTLPGYEFDECGVIDAPEETRVYGRYRECYNGCNRFLDNVDFDQLLTDTNSTYSNCQPHVCSESEIYYSNIQFNSGLEPVESIDESSNLGFCSAVYEVTGQEADNSIDDGCEPGYKANEFGVCQKCQTYFGFCSDCYLFLPDDDLCMTFNIFNYTYDKLNEDFNFKGHSFTDGDNNHGSDFSNYDKVFWDGYMSYPTTFDGLIWIYQSKRTPVCYEKTFNGGDQYSLSTLKNYFLQSTETAGFDISRQEEDTPNDPLNRFVCVRDCPTGFYYDYTSLSCRRCSFGCAKCSKYEKCDLCQAGLNEIEMTQDLLVGKNLGIWGEKLENKCFEGCIEGYYTKVFNGGCGKCEEDCKRCVDPFVFKNRVKRIGHLENGFCQQCKNIDGKEVYAHTRHGNCTAVCNGENEAVKEEVLPNGEVFKICSACHDLHCMICDQRQRSVCIQCSEGYEIDSETGICVIVSTSFFKILAYILIGIGVVIFFVCFYSCFASKMRGEREMLRAANRLVSIPDEVSLDSKLNRELRNQKRLHTTETT